LTYDIDEYIVIVSLIFVFYRVKYQLSSKPPKSMLDFVRELETISEINSLLDSLNPIDRVTLLNDDPRFDWVMDYVRPVKEAARIPPPGGMEALKDEVQRLIRESSSVFPPPKK
jgi:hypothetical protein